MTSFGGHSCPPPFARPRDIAIATWCLGRGRRCRRQDGIRQRDGTGFLGGAGAVLWHFGKWSGGGGCRNGRRKYCEAEDETNPTKNCVSTPMDGNVRGGAARESPLLLPCLPAASTCGMPVADLPFTRARCASMLMWLDTTDSSYLYYCIHYLPSWWCQNRLILVFLPSLGRTYSQILRAYCPGYSNGAGYSTVILSHIHPSSM